MLANFLIGLREGLEIGLVVGILVAYIRKVGRTEVLPKLWIGIALALGLALGVGALLTWGPYGLSTQGQEGIGGVLSIVAVVLVTWMIFWMHKQSRTIKSELETDVRRATMQTGKQALFLLAFFAVLREGIELALFLTASAFASGAQETIFGALLGLAAAAILGWGLFASTIRLDLRRFFQVTGVLLVLFAAGLVAHGVHEFNEVGWIPAVIEHVWDLNPVLDEQSTLGMILKALFGYNGDPSLTEVVAYLGYFTLIGVSLIRRDASPAPQEA